MKHLSILSRYYPLWSDDRCLVVVVGRIPLPPGYNTDTISMLIEIPDDYPLSPPGIGNDLIYVPPTLLFHGRKLKDVHPDREPDYPTFGFGPWAWWCYQEINWYPKRDNLIRLVEMIRTDLTNPPTE